MQGAQGYPGMSPGPMMPQASDYPALIHGITMGLGRWGSRYVGMPAIAMGTYATAFLNAYNQGMKERAAQNYQQYRQAREMMIDRQEEETKAYKDVYSAFHDDEGKVTDPTAFQQGLMAVASKYHDAPIENAIRSGNLGMVDRILQGRDGHLNDARKMKMQEDRQKQEDEERKLRIEEQKRKAAAEAAAAKMWGPGYVPQTGDGTDVPPASTPTPTSDTTPPDQTRTKPPTEPPDSTDQPDKTQPTTTGQAPTPQRAPQQPGKYAVPSSGYPALDAAAAATLMGRKPNIPKGAQGAVESRQSQLEGALDRINDDRNLDNNPDAIVDAVKQVSPELAGRLQTYLRGDLPQPTRQADQGWFDRIVALGAKAGSPVAPDTQKTRAVAKQSYARGGKQAQNLLAIGTAIKHIEDFKQTMGPNGENIPNWVAGVAKDFYGLGGGHLASKKDIDTAADLDVQSGIALREVERALVGGVGTQADRDQVAALGRWRTLGKETVRQVEALEKMFHQRVDQARKQFMAETGGTAEGFRKLFDAAAGDDAETATAKATMREELDTKPGAGGLPPGWSIK
jgi:hypothetical protein